MIFRGVGAVLIVLAVVSYQISAQETTPAAADGADGAMTKAPAPAGGDGGGDDSGDAGGDSGGDGGDGAATKAGDDAGGTEAPAAAEGEATTAASGAGDLQSFAKFVTVMTALSVGLMAKKD